MGDPKKARKTYQKPYHPWQRERIEEERLLMKEYALKNKRELWKANSILRDFKFQTKKLGGLQTDQAAIERSNLIKKMQKYGLVPENAQIDDILGLTLRNILDRRLQTVVYKKRFARTIVQARQFIVHRHILVDDKNIDVPGFLVPVAIEDKVRFKVKSSLAQADHPERVVVKVEQKTEPKIAEQQAKDSSAGETKQASVSNG